MAYDVAALKTRIRDRAGLTTSDSLVTSAVLLRLINAGLNTIALEADWPWLRVKTTLTTVAGTDEVSPPSLWLRTISLTHADTGEPLVRRHIKVLDRVPSTTQGRPYLYAVDGGKLTLRYTPNGAYSLVHRYVKSETELVADEDVPLLPEAYSQGLVEWCAAKALTMKKETERAQEAKMDYGAWLKRARDNINQGREPLRVEVRPGSEF
ncbi:MAG TPA: hypothetical protein VD926_12300 [Acidimicrobiales bacterium]|nr:hypothetical protein [Acidimicrobiales bacterium]